MLPLSRSRARTGVALLLGAALQLVASLPFARLHGPYPAISTAFGVLVAVLAGAVGGPWVGLAVAAAGWALNYAFVVDESIRALLALPAWLAAGFAAGWLAQRLESKASERELLEAELVAVRDAASDAIVGVDAAGKIVEWGAGAEAMYGYSPDEVEGRSLGLLTGGDGWQDGPDLMEAVRRGERLERAYAVHRRKDGGEVSASLSLTPLENGLGEAAGALLLATDVGEPLRARLQTSSTKRSVATTSFRFRSSMASSARCFGPANESGRPSSPQASSGPKIRNSRDTRPAF